MSEQQERQVSVEKLILKLRQQNEELSYQNMIKEALIEELDEKLNSALAQIDELSPTEDINDNPEG